MTIQAGIPFMLPARWVERNQSTLGHTTSSGLREVPDFIELMSLARQSPSHSPKSPYFSVLPEVGYLPAHTSEGTENELLGRAFNRERCVYSRCSGLNKAPDKRQHRVFDHSTVCQTQPPFLQNKR
ncbi:hypothetical protein IVB18_13410 [Bradyrhizobium sp. 186]|uniref:hypothetical protein n=1 Tax=Bradyrhizobium sp. 186 TaxID=2782654 RepID=UPI0020011999|nr:hypothetical protein [Bradyrhizobium sp. 186]UPK38172.1 hypothetical protein IVB18_13410 [Bradyrhizobium sp. 186]